MSPSRSDRSGSARPDERVLLRAARQDRGWSQADAARELVRLAARTGSVVAGPASLKTQLSRWENGHATPEPEYRALLGRLYDRGPGDLGLEPPADPPAGRDPFSALRAGLAEAEGLDGPSLALLRDQLDATVRLDRRLGAAGAGEALAAQVDRLVVLAGHTLPEPARRAVHGLLADAALLAGAQERDRERPVQAWARFRLARSAALEAGRSGQAARARAESARLLVDAGLADRARELLGSDTDPWTMLARAEAEAAGTSPDPHRPGQGGRALRAGHAFDAVRPGLGLELDLIRHRRAVALAGVGDPAALDALEHATDEDAPVRDRAERLAASAVALDRAGRPSEAAEQAHRARLLALRIGADRVVSRLVGPGTAAGADEGRDRAR